LRGREEEGEVERGLEGGLKGRKEGEGEKEMHIQKEFRGLNSTFQ
jgi:hypothetical protein